MSANQCIGLLGGAIGAIAGGVTGSIIYNNSDRIIGFTAIGAAIGVCIGCIIPYGTSCIAAYTTRRVHPANKPPEHPKTAITIGISTTQASPEPTPLNTPTQ